MGHASAGQRLTQMITGGPVQPATMARLRRAMRDPTEYGVWWAIWDATLQDYRQFGTPHAGSTQIVFADGSMRSIHRYEQTMSISTTDFPANSATGFQRRRSGGDRRTSMFSRWQLKIE